MSVFFVTLRGQCAVRSRGYTLSRFSVAVYGSFDAVLSDFSKVIALSDGLDNSHFCCQVAPDFLPNFDKKKLRKV